MSNILLTSIGSIASEAVIVGLGTKNNIIGCDIYPHYWLAQSELVSKFYQVPLASEKEKYITDIITICKAEKADYIIPLNDEEVDILSENHQLFKDIGVTLCLSDNETIKLCRDKYSVYKFFEEKQINLIPTFSYLEIKAINRKVKFISKPRTGRSSEGLFVISSDQQLECLIDIENNVFQPFYDGNIITADIVRNSITGKIVSIARREYIRTKNGAGLTVEIFEDARLTKTLESIAIALNINGCINVEFIEFDDQFYLMDINPRFSAGVAFSIKAGYNMASNHLKCFQHSEIDSVNQIDKMVITRKFVEVEKTQSVKDV